MEWDIMVMIKSVCNFEDLQKNISPEKLSEGIISVLSKSIVTKNKFTAWHSSAHCHNSDTCSQCQTLMILSTVTMILDFYKAKNSKPSSSLSSITAVNYTLEENLRSEYLDKNNTDIFPEEDSLLSSKSKDQHSEWYKKTISALFDKGICSLLVPLLQCHCQFISFSARKTLVKGLQSNLFKMTKVLAEVDRVPTQSLLRNGEIVDFLTQIIAGKNLSKYIKDFTCEWIFDHGFLEFGLEMEKMYDLSVSTYTQTYKMMRLWNCLLKYISQNGSPVELPEKVFEYYQRQLKDLYKSWNVQKRNEAGLLCTQFLKFVSCIFLFQSKFPEIVCETSYLILEHSSTFVSKGFANALFDKTDFIGYCIKHKERDRESIQEHSSSLTKRLTLIILEATVIALQSNQDKRNVMRYLESLLCNMVMYQKPSTDFQPTTEWLIFVFSDQDDKWIAALFHFLRIWRYVKSHGWQEDDLYQQPGSLLPVNSEINMKNAIAKDNFNKLQTELHTKLTSHNLLEMISPHKFFIQFLTFLKFDHLVLADFLSSKETEFLPYFISYLHDLENDWIGFQDICKKMDSESTKASIGCSVELNGSQEGMDMSSSASCIPPQLNFDNNHINEFSSVYKNRQTTAVNVNISKKRKHLTSSGDRQKKKSLLNKSIKCVNDSFSLVVYSDSSATNTSDSSDSNLSCEDADQNSELDLKLKEDNSSDDSFEEKRQRSESDRSQPSNYCETIEDQVMGALIRLRFYIQRLCDNHLFPFNIKPLLKQLMACERYYDDIA